MGAVRSSTSFVPLGGMRMQGMRKEDNDYAPQLALEPFLTPIDHVSRRTVE